MLVPSDLSDVSLEALRAAIALGEIVDAQIHVVHALDGPGAPPVWYGAQAQELYKEFLAERRLDARRQLEQQLIHAKRDRVPEVGIHVDTGRPDETILRAIEDLQIDLVVMGTSARSGLQAWTMGNTTERLVSQMPCSLLAVKPRGFECPVAALKQPA